jgi:hypothetical protein
MVKARCAHEASGTRLRGIAGFAYGRVTRFALLAVLFLAMAPPGQAGTFTVSNLNDDGAGSLRQAILAANATAGADTITFGSALGGTLTLASPLPTIADAAGLTIRGPGVNTITISGDHAVRVFNVASGAALTLDALTVANGGKADLVASDLVDGGGIYNAGVLTITNCALSGNTAGLGSTNSSGIGTDGGGGIFNSGALTVTSSVLSGNAAGYGGAIFNSGTATVTDTTISGNGGNFFPLAGGGIANNGTLRVTGSTVSTNAAFGFGGGIANSGTLTIGDSTLSENRTLAEGGSGILNQSGGILTITNSTLSNNGGSAQGDGGAILNVGTATVGTSTVSGNTAGSTGGGIFNGGTLTVANATLVGNSAGLGGGGICNGGSGNLAVSFSTLAGNTTSGPLGGGGIRAGCFPGQTGTGVTTLVSTLLVNNSDRNCAVGAVADGGYNISSDASCGFSLSTSLAGTDPTLGPLADNGGPTQTMALLAGSPAVNRIPAGVNGCGTDVATDQRGLPRPVGPGCDVGAYEDAALAVQLAYLLTAVTDIGPGKSFADKVKQIEGFVAANATTAACVRLNAFTAEVRAQVGKKISSTQEALFASAAQDVESTLRC